MATEIRIGNLLEFSNMIEPNKITTVNRRFFSSASIDKEDGNFNVSNYYMPIPLTEEWLIEFGFVAYAKHCNYTELCIKSDNPSKHIVVRFGLQKKYFTVFNHSECDFTVMQYLTEIHYVHQLQNLYFALTQKELTYD